MLEILFESNIHVENMASSSSREPPPNTQGGRRTGKGISLGNFLHANQGGFQQPLWNKGGGSDNDVGRMQMAYNPGQDALSLFGGDGAVVGLRVPNGLFEAQLDSSCFGKGYHGSGLSNKT